MSAVDSFTYALLVQVSLFAVGSTAAAIGTAIVKRPRRWWAYALGKSGSLGIVGIILYRVLPALNSIHTSAWTFAYEGCVLAIAVGNTFIAGDLARRAGKKDSITNLTPPEN